MDNEIGLDAFKEGFEEIQHMVMGVWKRLQSQNVILQYLKVENVRPREAVICAQ